MQQFSRLERLIGADGLQRLQEASVAVVGLGAVGGHVTEALARSGVGRLRLYDHDTIGPSNVNRQLLAVASTLGRNKADVARERVLDINPDCRVDGHPLFIHEETLAQVLKPRPDVVVDAIDAVNPKLALLAGAWARDIPTFSSMGAALRRRTDCIHVADLMDSYQCPLARRMRKLLRRRDVGRGITCVFSSEEVEFDYTDPDAEDHSDDPQYDRGRRRRVLGSLPTVTGIFGLTLANEVLNHLTSA
jgi:tRNA A37 threonylcarbamoyladenosine dehydratase